MSTERVMRFVGEIDFGALDLVTQAKVTAALAELEVLKNAGCLTLETKLLRRYRHTDGFRKPRSDKLGDQRAIQPQQQRVLGALGARPDGMTADELAAALDIPSGGARGQVNLLRERGLVRVVLDGRPKRWGLA